MKKIISAIMVCIVLSSLSLLNGCNTVQGIGKDVSKGGRDIQRAAS